MTFSACDAVGSVQRSKQVDGNEYLRHGALEIWSKSLQNGPGESINAHQGPESLRTTVQSL